MPVPAGRVIGDFTARAAQNFALDHMRKIVKRQMKPAALMQVDGRIGL
jgi:hypothetical protein